jgi:hypothetical protein
MLQIEYVRPSKLIERLSEYVDLVVGNPDAVACTDPWAYLLLQLLQAIKAEFGREWRFAKGGRSFGRGWS